MLVLCNSFMQILRMLFVCSDDDDDKDSSRLATLGLEVRGPPALSLETHVVVVTSQAHSDG